jgi:hypothetical protein
LGRKSITDDEIHLQYSSTMLWRLPHVIMESGKNHMIIDTESLYTSYCMKCARRLEKRGAGYTNLATTVTKTKWTAGFFFVMMFMF